MLSQLSSGWRPRALNMKRILMRWSRRFADAIKIAVNEDEWSMKSMRLRNLKNAEKSERKIKSTSRF